MTLSRTIIIGSRGSDLALWQAHHVQDQLTDLGVKSEIHIIKTQGDKIQHLSFDKLEGKGFFTKEIEESLLNGAIDLAVHSHKDLETTPPAGLVIGAVSEREDPSELLLIKKTSLDKDKKFSLKEGAVVGTSSARRKSQILALRPDVQLKDLRGNVPTRVNKLRDQDYDAILLAAAGVSRLGLDLSDLEVMKLDPREFIPAPAQGVLALQIREKDTELAELLANLNQGQVAEQIGVEREVLRKFEGGCQLPLGVYCQQQEGKFQTWASAADAWDETPTRVYLESDSSDGLADRIVAALKKKPSSESF